MIKVKISATIANDYMTRDAYDFIGNAGIYQLTQDQAQELCDDAIYQALHTDCTPSGIVRAYSALASNLLASGCTLRD